MQTDDWRTLDEHFDADDIAALAAQRPIARLSLHSMGRLSATRAQELRKLPSLQQLHLNCDVSRAAMREVLAIAGLRELDVLCILPRGRPGGFAQAKDLRVFRELTGLAEADLLDVARCPGLVELGIQSSRLTPRAFDALMGMTTLQTLDIEATPFDDAMAAQLARLPALTGLHAGRTAISRAGLEAICELKQMRELDLWATSLSVDDLYLLRGLPALEYLSIGGAQGYAPMPIESLLPLLDQLPSLRRLWLDGVAVPDSVKAWLASRYPDFRAT